MIVDSGTTSTIGSIFDDSNDKFIPTGEKSTKVFKVANGIVEKATKKKLLQHKLCPASREVNIVPGITNSLLSTSKLADDDTLQYLIRTKWKSLMQLTRKSSQLVVQSSEDSGAQSPVYIVYHLCQQMK